MLRSYVVEKRNQSAQNAQDFLSQHNGLSMFACLYVPDFPVQAALLLEPTDTREALRRSPIVVLDGPATLLKVVALNDAARHFGIELGMTKLQVETCGGVLLQKR